MSRKAVKCKRLKRRQQLLYALNNELIDPLHRVSPSDEDQKQFIKAINMNKISLFGVGRLVNINLDGDISEYLSVKEYCSRKITLLSYAARQGRDAIVSALYRAGANPVSYSEDRQFLYNLRKALNKRPYSNIVWIIRLVTDLSVTTSQGARAGLCTTCNQTYDNDTEHLRLPGCGHIICEKCFWHCVAGLAPIDDACCPQCKVPIADSTSGEQIKKSYQASNLSCGEGREYDTNAKIESFDRWMQVPEDLLKTVPKRPPFKALSLSGIASLYLGFTRTARTTELLKAAAQGNNRRILALFEAGINIDAVNEYGQSAIFLATWYRRWQTISLLRSLGCDMSIKDNVGLSPVMLVYNTIQGGSLMRNLYGEEVERTDVPRSSTLSDDDLAMREDDILTHCPRIVDILIDPNDNHPGAGAFCADGFFRDADLVLIEELFSRLPIAEPEKLSCSSRAYVCDASGWIRTVLAKALRCITEHLKSNGYFVVMKKESEQSVDATDGDEDEDDVIDSEDEDQCTGCDPHSKSVFNPFDENGQKNGKQNATMSVCTETLPCMKFIQYSYKGGSLAPHIDLPKHVDYEVRMRTYEFASSSSATAAKPATTATPLSPASSSHTFVLYLRTCDQGGETLLLRAVPGRRVTCSLDDLTIAAIKPKRGRLLVFPHECPHAGAEVIDVPKLLLRGEMI